MHLYILCGVLVITCIVSLDFCVARNVFFSSIRVGLRLGSGYSPGGGGGEVGGTRLPFGEGGRKRDPVSNRSAHKNTPCQNIPY